MTETSLKATPDLAPLTVAHGQKLFDQNRLITTLVDQLQPLLALIDENNPKLERDPIAEIVELLTIIVNTQQRQDQHQLILGKKLDYLIEKSNGREQFGASTE